MPNLSNPYSMTPEEKSIELIEKFGCEIRTSDFHIPEFISGVPCADGNEEYGKLLEKETVALSRQCAVICVQEIISEIKKRHRDKEYGQGECVPSSEIEYWNDVLTSINTHK